MDSSSFICLALEGVIVDKNTKILICLLAAGFVYHDIVLANHNKNLRRLLAHRNKVEQMITDAAFQEIVERYDEGP